jgi:hypothetical protein
VIRKTVFQPLSFPSLPASLLLISAAVGAIVIGGLAALLLVPLTVLLGSVAIWLLALALLGWATIEALAACERWMEHDSRFLR